MGHSFLEFRNKSQLLNDFDIIFVVHITLDAIRNSSDRPTITSGIKELLDYWETLTNIYGPGCLETELDRFVVTEDDRACLLRLLELARSLIEHFGATVPGDYLNRIINAPALFHFPDEKTSNVLAAFDKFIGVLI